MVGVDIFIINDGNLVCIVDYYSKFPVIKDVENQLAEDLIQAARVLFSEFGLPTRLVSDAGMNSVSEQFKIFCRCLNIDQIVTSACHHQSNGQVEVCIKSVKCTRKKCRHTNNDVHFALLQI